MNREEDIIKLIQQMCDDDREEEVVRMIDDLPDEERTYKIVGLQARTLSNLAGMIRSGYTESELNPDDLDRRHSAYWPTLPKRARTTQTGGAATDTHAWD